MMKPSSSLPSYQTGEYYTPNNTSGGAFEEYTEDDVIAKSRSDAKNAQENKAVIITIMNIIMAVLI